MIVDVIGGTVRIVVRLPDVVSTIGKPYSVEPKELVLVDKAGSENELTVV